MQINKLGNLQRLKLSILSIVSILILTNCGFHFQTFNYLPPQLHTIYIQTDNVYDEFIIDFKQALIMANIKLATKPQTAPYTIHITPSVFHYANLGIKLSTSARIYTLTLTTTIKITDKQQKEILPNQMISVSRIITLDPNEIIYTSAQKDIIHKEMNKELTKKIFNLINATQITQILHN